MSNVIDTIGSWRESERARINYERDLLEPGQLAEYDDQCRLLVEANEEPISVAEYLKCRLDDASEEIERLRTIGPSAMDGHARAELAPLQSAAHELCDWASEAREFFGDDVGEDPEAYAVSHHLRDAERAVRVLLNGDASAE